MSGEIEGERETEKELETELEQREYKGAGGLPLHFITFGGRTS